MTLYPSIKPYIQHQLKTNSAHVLYVEECGSPDGLPVLFIHGGPGGGCTINDRRFFDPTVYRIILFDQRGCGRSTPHGCIEDNTTAHLIEDIELIRSTLLIDQWVLFGGSWGATLSLLYAQAHANRVLAMIIRGVFLVNTRDMQWFYEEGGAARIFPEHWEAFRDHIPLEEQGNLLKAYYKRLHAKEEWTQLMAAKHWAQWEAHCATLEPCQALVQRFTEPHMALGLALLETHYFIHQAFIEPDQILLNMSCLESIPGIIIHGRYDMICAIDNAFAVHKRWPNSQLQIIREAGHASMEVATISALVGATQKIATLFNAE